MCVFAIVATVGIIKMYSNTIGRLSRTIGYVTLALVYIPYNDPQSVMFF